MRIAKADIAAIQEPLKAAFAFKGRSSAQPMWNTAVRLTSEGGAEAMGLSNQGILWSDAAIHGRFSEIGGNALMYLMGDYARQIAGEYEFDTPDQLLRQILPRVWEYGRAAAGGDMRETFALNSLVALDTAAWLMYAREKGRGTFDELVPGSCKSFLATRHERLAAIPLITYSASMDDIKNEVEGGRFFLKIKIGSDPEHDGDQEKMLRWDMERIRTIHEALGDIPCEYSESGHIPYYLDANGRYAKKDTLMRLMEYIDSIGALGRIAIMEEPFPEELEVDVGDIPVRLAADESAHSDSDVNARIDMGYRAIALKPIAKTMSMTFDMIKVCAARDIPCFCADLTVNAWMVDLNKNFAARLAALPGIKVGLLESNGHQYYARWGDMCRSLPYPDGGWIGAEGGLYELGDSFYELSGGIFGESRMYTELFN